MRRLIATLTAGAVLLVAAACGKDWFGNEQSPKATPTPPTCAAKEVPAPQLSDILGGRRPTTVPPGWSWIVIALEVRALKSNDTVADYCVPFGLHVYATLEGAGVVPMIDPRAGQLTLPYDAIKTTPWTGAYLLFAYDPSSSRWTNHPPTYEVTVIATYMPERDMLGAGKLAAFRCALRANGATIVQDMKVAEAQMVTRCNLKASIYNPA